MHARACRATLERLIARIRHRVRDRRWQALAEAFTPDQQRRIGQLFVDDGSGKMALDDLRAAPRQLAPGELIRHLERIDAIRVQDLACSTVAGVPDAVIERLARSGRTMRATALGRYVFSLPDAVANGELRLLRNPNYE